ncbi:YhdP family protein [Leeia aquatica]|uniref:TIGR02099 family protein n=1 Tax=Leeia aquatica TaxID=2725557 RepID=A0A847SDR4_9NEIS|nr:YhdP family protein [Leeia aquatica]NLR75318.1 TIGR02099 family protein [Leeia aquatica]
MTSLPETLPTEPAETELPAVMHRRGWHRLPQRVLRWHGRWLWRLLLLLVFLLFALIGGLRYWLLPHIDDYRPWIADKLTASIGIPVQLDRLEGEWQGLNPTLVVHGFRMLDPQQRPAIQLKRVDTTLSWWSLLSGEIRFADMRVEQPALDFRRSRDGVIYLAGLPLNRSKSTPDNAFPDWLLKQGRIRIEDAQLSWIDELRNTPPITLSKLDVTLLNRLGRHRLAVRGTPPADLASELDFRANLQGERVQDWQDWTGQLYLRQDYVDMARLRTWLPVSELPQGVPSQGRGGVQVWLKLNQGRVADATVDVALRDVRLRMAETTPELALRQLSGRVYWALATDRLQVKTNDLRFDLRDGTSLPPLSLDLTLLRDGPRSIKGGTLTAVALPLSPFARLAAYFPLPAPLPDWLNGLSPRGALKDVKLAWQGSGRPAHYSADAQLDDLGISAWRGVPGVDHLNGRIRITENQGELALQSGKQSLALPGVFEVPLPIDRLQLNAGWLRQPDGQWSVQLDRLQLSSPDLEGVFHGQYRTEAKGSGWIDLRGELARGEANAVWKYLPLVTAEDARHWLKASLLQGRGVDGRLQLTGRLDEFPFDKKKGLFHITARAENVLMQFNPSWPKVEQIQGEIEFLGDVMTVRARQARIMGTQVQQAEAKIGALSHAELLTVEGTVNGPMAAYLDYAQKSPVKEVVGDLLDDAVAKGDATLQLQIKVPLRHAVDTSVNGALRFQNNRLQINPSIPVIDRAEGTLLFTEKTFGLQGGRAMVLGHPASFVANTDASGTVRLSGSGRAGAAALRQQFELPFEHALQGETDWQALIALNKRRTDVRISSTLQGLAIDLPQPMRKAAAESLPLQLERLPMNDDATRWNIRLGTLLAASMRQQDGKLERASIQLGKVSGVPELHATPGLTVMGNLARLDMDAWIELLQAEPSGSSLPVQQVQAGVTELEAAGRIWHDVQVKASQTRYGPKQESPRWTAQVSARELEGRVDWLPEKDGLVVARLKRLALPKQQDTVTKGLSEGKKSRQPPALDIEVAQFQYGDKQLGELKALARPDGEDWRLQQVRLTVPEAVLSMDGQWQDNAPNSVLKINLKIDTSDAGALLDRLGYPNTLKRGKAVLEGQLAWAGSPFEPNIPTLAGKLTLQAREGQFVKLDPGAGRLLGVLSLQALPRRIALDFRDVFSDGLGFDEITASARVQQGVMHTDDFKLTSPVAGVVLRGDIDLVRETQTLHVRVVPVVGDSVSVAAGLALSNPVAGLAAFLLQKILRDPIGQMVAFEYDVTGPWSNPNVVKTGDGQKTDKPVTSK